MRRLKAGIIGLGVGERHIAGYQAHPSCDVVALCDFAPEKLESAKGRYPGMRLYDRAEDLLRDPGIDVVSIASWDNHHRDHVVAAAESGKHVFVEKPLCVTAGEAADIRRALAANTGVRMTSNLILRRYPRFLWLKERIECGEMGAVYAMEGDYNYGRVEKILGGWRGRVEGYAPILGGGVHLVDLMLWLAGGRKVVEVSAMGNGLATAGRGLGYDDYCAALLRFEDGMTAKVSANLACVHPHFHPLTVYGTGATFINGLPEGRYYRTRDPEAAPEPVTAPYPGSAKGDMIPGFLDAILEGREPEVPVEDIFAAMSVCFAIMESARKRSVVAVEYI